MLHVAIMTINAVETKNATESYIAVLTICLLITGPFSIIILPEIKNTLLLYDAIGQLSQIILS